MSIFRIPSFPPANHRWAPQVGQPTASPRRWVIGHPSCKSVPRRGPWETTRIILRWPKNGTQESCYATGFGSPLVPLNTRISIEPIGGRSILSILDARSGWQRSELPHTFELPNWGRPWKTHMVFWWVKWGILSNFNYSKLPGFQALNWWCVVLEKSNPHFQVLKVNVPDYLILGCFGGGN